MGSPLAQPDDQGIRDLPVWHNSGKVASISVETRIRLVPIPATRNPGKGDSVISVATRIRRSPDPSFSGLNSGKGCLVDLRCNTDKT